MEIKVTEIESKELTAQEKKALAKAEADREKAITKAVKLFDKAMEKVEGSAWELCEVVYKTLNADNFKELFGKKETYAKAIGQSPSTIPNMKRSTLER